MYFCPVQLGLICAEIHAPSNVLDSASIYFENSRTFQIPRKTDQVGESIREFFENLSRSLICKECA